MAGTIASAPTSATPARCGTSATVPKWPRQRPRTRKTEKAGEKTKKRRGPKPDSHRQVFISRYRSQQRQAILYTQTAAFKTDMKLRPAIERTIAAGVPSGPRYNGARRAKSIGLAKADFQVRMAALAFNLKRWLALTLAKEKAQRHRSAQVDDG